MMTTPHIDTTRGPATPGAALVSAAQRATNAHDAHAAARVYASDATLELVIDGAVSHHVGREAIREAWAVVLGAGARSGFRVSKTLVAETPDVVVNRWEGTIGRRRRCRGIETWRLDGEGRVVEHRAESFLTVGPAAGLRMGLRALVDSPRVALAFVRATRAVRRGSHGVGV